MGSDPAGMEGKCSSPWSAFCADSYLSICSTPVLPQLHVKDPGHSAKGAGDRLQLNMLSRAEQSMACIHPRMAKSKRNILSLALAYHHNTPYACGFA